MYDNKGASLNRGCCALLNRGLYCKVYMNNNPLQPTPGSLPQPIATEETSLPVGHEQGDSTTTSVQNASSLPPQMAPQQLVAPDADDLSPEWIQKVNSVVRQNVNEPKVFSQEFERLKAQYIAGRYGKELKQQGEKG